jgi:hypothetical protein
MMKIMNETARKYKIISHCVSNLADELQDAHQFLALCLHELLWHRPGRAWLGILLRADSEEREKILYYLPGLSYGHDVGEGFKKGLKEYYPEAQVVGEDYHKLFLTDFAPYLTKIRASGAEVICTGNWPPDGGNLLKQARQMGIDLPFAHVLMNDPNMLHDVGLEGTKGLVHIDEFNTPPPPFKSPGHIKYYRAWNSQWKKWKTPPYNSHFFEHGDYIQKYIMQTYWLMSVLERAKSTDPEKIIKVWEGDTFQYVNGKIMMMRCDQGHPDYTVSGLCGDRKNRSSPSIFLRFTVQRICGAGPGALVPAAKVFPPIDPKEERCKGKNGWGE